ncbi:UDP-N-acetylmuramoylalanyl-D-glutamate--2,6-diaminopimelate ligase [Cryobacterium roopkundense]|uniref:UDP-N-acetylmuramoyl-tripeptide--D-alanyl-D-alanine ligase n=1 Tax=Cryobacterium roopkundense TaxID=1001240 RepID=A0A099JYL0_9MICO|nr:UDP-N-acetylmuramoyl-tripeptide--D-alanyl-D-alanine ligase [Cryobacterium roopkundense]KGJ82847.1 UDP-N-acetylmuramoylalanyl-D-glutamate--2,6-diaminopimelate ligase [Cryobacterium roopkundense]MBB5640877.1 UDP-N-acetylmuramoyl-tripeptide--D-alanyl-D-alanine ligase [Cryobacterium roopkundense]
MIALSLRQVTEATAGVLHLAAGTVDDRSMISGTVQTDSREVTPGSIFVAKPGEVTDGHLFAPTAVERGAELLIVERLLDLPVAQIVVADVVVALGALASDVVARVRSAGRLKVVGVTGSNGKTTTKNLLREILERVGPTVAPRGSFNNQVGAPMTMLEVTHETEYLVVEMGASGVGAIARLVDLVRPDIGIVLTVGLAHAGEFGGLDATVLAKSEMVTELLPTDVAVLNADDPRVAGMSAVTHARVVPFGEYGNAVVRATDVRAGRSGTSFILHLASGQSSPVVFRVLGEHHITNALAAAAAAEVLGVPLDTIVAALESVRKAERWRMEVLGGRDGITVINDAYNASPDSMTAALKTLAQIQEPDTRTIAVLGEMAELGALAGEEHDRVGLLAVRLNISQVVVVGAGARRMHISTINEGSWDGESAYVDTADEAFELVRTIVRPGDTILVKSSNSAGLRFLGDRLGDLYS